MGIYYIIGFLVFIVLAKVVKKTNKMLSKIFTTIGIGAVILTFTNLGNEIALFFNIPSISTVSMILSVLFFIFLLIKLWIKTIKIFIIAIILFVLAMVPLGLDTYVDFQDNENHAFTSIAENISEQ